MRINSKVIRATGGVGGKLLLEVVQWLFRSREGRGTASNGR
jgi:hypothetical protein